MELKDTTTYTV